MMFAENLKMALAAVRAARFRSFLTMFGIIVAVISVLTIASLGEGIKRQISGQTQTVGQDLITIRPGKLVERNDKGEITGINLFGFLSSSFISDKDLEMISNDPNVGTAVPMSVVSGVPSINNNRTYDQAFIVATNTNLPEVTATQMEFGDFFDKGDADRSVAIIGKNIADRLFQENVPLSKSMQIRGEEFVVSGVLERAPANPLSPEADYNNVIYIPYSAGKRLAGDDLRPYEVLVRPKDHDPARVDQTIASLTELLKQSHGGQEDFTILRQEDMQKVADDAVSMVTNSVAIIAAVALVVGGIGIMNVMLVSVTERTREIGIRKTVGATNRQIQTQFLIEAVVISGWGAVVGIFLAGVINLLFRVLTHLQPVLTWQMVALVGFVSIAVGVFFGMIPAVKASRKDPIEALRTE